MFNFNNIIISFLIFLLLISYYKRNSKQILNNNINTEKTKREILYLEFSIVGKNSPFNNYYKNNEFTVLSYLRFKNIGNIVENIINNNIDGDILEAGNWRGGSMLYAKGVLEAYGINNKEVWLFDTFSGFPNNTIINDQKEIKLIKGKESDRLRDNSVKKVKQLFEVYHLSKGVHFIEGLFDDTIAKTKIPKLSYLRLDADNYINTKFLLENLYDRLNKNGYIEFDDYGYFSGCKKAVDEFRVKNNIHNKIIYEYEHPGIDDYYEAVYWIK